MNHLLQPLGRAGDTSPQLLGCRVPCCRSPQERRKWVSDRSLLPQTLSPLHLWELPTGATVTFPPISREASPPPPISGKGVLGRLGQEVKQALHPQIQSTPLRLQLPGNAIRMWVGYKDGCCSVKTSVWIPSNQVTPEKATLISTLSEVRWEAETEIQGQASLLCEAAETGSQVR